MSMKPKLSICVPSRNRQEYFQETIRALLRSARPDVEFIFTDNSLDPRIMIDFFDSIELGPRIKFLPALERVVPMNDNYERCIVASSGDFVCIIGDDDYVDPNVVDLIYKIEEKYPEFDVVAWNRLQYTWPSARDRKNNISICVGNNVVPISKKLLIMRNFLWQDQHIVPNNPFCFYHGAVSRKTLEKIKFRYNQRYAEHITADFENASKLLMVGNTFIFCERAYSVLGVCAESHSATVGNWDSMKNAVDVAMAEIGRNIDEDPYMKDFPFPIILGVTSAVAQMQQWFKYTYNLKFDGWEKNFAEACAMNCALSKNDDIYDLMYQGYYQAFKKWKSGQFLKFFLHNRPDFNKKNSTSVFTGYSKGKIYIPEDISVARTPEDVYNFASQIAVPLEQLEFWRNGDVDIGHHPLFSKENTENRSTKQRSKAARRA